VMLLGFLLVYNQTHTFDLTAMRGVSLSGGIAVLILIGIITKSATLPFHTWLPDAGVAPSTVTSMLHAAVLVKIGVYAYARLFNATFVLPAGWETGIAVLVMASSLVAACSAAVENDIKRILAYSTISQVGYMVCGVGLGSYMAMNGSTAHAFCHILYKALLFMGAGAVIYVTGRRKLTELQGRNLYKQMPICLSLYMIGGFSISAVPLFNGFVSKTMVVAAAGELHRPAIHLLLHLASIGTFLHTGLKLPYGTWFGRAPKGEEVDEIEAHEPPLNMLIAMGMTAFLCIFTGVYPKVLYNILPYPVDFHPYTPYKVVAMMQLLLLTAAAFWIYIDKLGGEATISVDTDWFYRKPGLLLLWFCIHPLQNLRLGLQRSLAGMVASATGLSKNPMLLPEIAIRFIHLKVVNGLYHISGMSEDKLDTLKHLESRITELRKMTYN